MPSLGYAQIPRILQPPVVTNAASWSLDLSWSAESSSMSNSSNEWEGGVLVTGRPSWFTLLLCVVDIDIVIT